MYNSSLGISAKIYQRDYLIFNQHFWSTKQVVIAQVHLNGPEGIGGTKNCSLYRVHYIVVCYSQDDLYNSADTSVRIPEKYPTYISRRQKDQGSK